MNESATAQHWAKRALPSDEVANVRVGALNKTPITRRFAGNGRHLRSSALTNLQKASLHFQIGQFAAFHGAPRTSWGNENWWHRRASWRGNSDPVV